MVNSSQLPHSENRGRLQGAGDSLGGYTLPSGSLHPITVNEGTRPDNLEVLVTFQSFLWHQAEAGLS